LAFAIGGSRFGPSSATLHDGVAGFQLRDGGGVAE
jgi:hypothetical protein